MGKWASPFKTVGGIGSAGGGVPHILNATQRVHAVIAGALFYAVGNFGFLNIFGIRREAQAVLFVLLILLLPRLSGVGRVRREPLLYLTLVFFMARLFLRDWTIIDIFDSLTSIGIIIVIFGIDMRKSEAILRMVILFSAVFSTMVIVQAVIIWFNPSLIAFVNYRPYSSMSSDDLIQLQHPIEYLGFTTGDYIRVLGRDFVRFNSFASEPSVLIYSFLVPGILALTFKNHLVRLLSIPILFFAVVLAAAGTAWLSLAVGMAVFPFFYLFKNRPRFLHFLPYIAIALFLFFVINVDSRQFMADFDTFFQSFSEIHSDPSEKYSSGIIRIGSIRDTLDLVLEYPLGVPFSIGRIGGLLLTAGFDGGFLGVIVCLILSYRMFRVLTAAVLGSSGITRIAMSLVYGIMIQVLCFSDYGWTTFSGIMMLALLLTRAEYLVARNEWEMSRGPVFRPVPVPVAVSADPAYLIEQR